MQLIWSLLSIFFLNMQRVSGIIMPIVRRKRLCTTTYVVQHTACVQAPHDHGQNSQCWTPNEEVHILVLLTMGIMMLETCWDRRMTINFRLVASCWFLSLPCIHVLCGMSLQVVTIVTKLKNNHKYIRFQSNTTIFYYSTYWQQVSVTRPSPSHHYVKFKTG